jgi:hypothetical protein
MFDAARPSTEMMVEQKTGSPLDARSAETQSPAPRCPQLVIACPLYIVEQNTQLRFSALVAGQDLQSSLGYSWKLTGGTISEGQGTPSITVDTTGLGGRRITATVNVNGLARECQSTASCAIQVAKPTGARRADTRAEERRPANRAETGRPAARAEVRQPEATTRPTEAARPAEDTRRPGADAAGRLDSGGVRRLNTYGELVFDVEKTRLAGLAAALRKEPDAQGYIIVYGGHCSADTQAQERAERAKDWLINQHGIDASRIVTIDGGYRDTLTTEIFIGPLDAALPELKAAVQPPDQSRCK